MQDSKEKQCLIFVRNNANDTADRIEAYAKKSGMEVVETVFNTDKKAVERLRYYIERDAIICVLVRDVVDISMELNEIIDTSEYVEPLFFHSSIVFSSQLQPTHSLQNIQGKN